ncbi:fibronectin type III domain-containing protein [Planktomarina temperata]|nr:fibronectin type III domain-containing protein [Planktomarina temperata]
MSNTAVTNDVNYLAGGTYPFYIGTPPTNSAPTANAGPDQTSVASAATVTLDGLGSTDQDGDTLTYAWTQTSGTTMTLSSTTADKPTFTAPTLNIGDAAATLVFSLTVNDGTVDSTADTVSITVNAPSATTANAPTALVATAGDGQVSIAFTAPSNNGGAAITDYEYQLDGGAWTSSGKTSSPVVITGLTNGTSYSIKLRAVNSAGDGTESDAVTSTPAATSNAPTALVATPGDAQVSVAFTAPTSNGGAAITDYEYQLDGGAWTSSGKTSSPVVITGLTNGTSYSIKLRAVNSAGNGAESAAVTSTPATTSDAPTALVATAGDGQVSVAFTAPSNDGGAAITDYQYELDDSGTWTSASTATSPVVITGLTNGTAYSIKLRAVNSAGNGAESAAVNVLLGSPASEFAAKEDAIRSVITDDAQRLSNSTVASNTRLTRDARGRFLTSRTQMQSDGASLASRNNIALDVDGIAVANPEQLSTQGMFLAQTGNFEGTQRRLVFGDFDIQRDGDTGSTTATINGKVAWEQMLSEQTMLGYYLGGEVARSNIRGSFTGTQRKYGVSFGGYFVHALQGNLFLDGIASLGAGRNNLEMADDTLALTSDYTTRTATMGAAVSGVYEYGQYDFHPELAFSYGKTWIGDVGFTGVAYGLTDDALSLDAGNVSIANLTLRPEIVWALDAETVTDSNAQLSFAPRLICERTSAAATTQDCGAGAEIGLSSTSEDGLSSANIRFVMDRVGNSNRSNVVFNVEHRF